MLYNVRLTPHELLKPIRKGPNANSGLSRCEVLVKKIENKEPLRLAGSETAVLIEDLTPEQKAAILSGDKKQLRDVRLGEYKLSDFAKTDEFGSYKPEMTGENNQVKILDTAIKMWTAVKGPIDIFLGPYVFPDIAGARQITERIEGKLPKADVALVDDNGYDVAWFSMKTNRYDNPRDNQQYSGISRVSGVHVSEADETVEFVRDIRHHFPLGVPCGMTVSKDIKSESLKVHAIFGSDSLYDDYGPNKCHAVIHGVPSLIPTVVGAHELTSNGKIILFGEVPTDGYEPVFIACYRTDRNTAGIHNTRIMIYPRDGRRSHEVL